MFPAQAPLRSGTLTQHCSSNNEPEISISSHSVLPSPEEGLARRISEITPMTALTFSTPWGLRVPVTAPPRFGDEEIAAHQQRASNAWSARWTERERRRVLKALDENRRTVGGRYLELAQLHPWVTLALERAGVVDQPALYLAERLTEPPLSWFAVEQARLNGGSLRPESPWIPVVAQRTVRRVASR
jgi:hypothetical protein